MGNSFEVEQRKTVYLRLHKTVAVKSSKTVTLGDVAKLSAEPQLEQRLSLLPLIPAALANGDVQVIDILQIVKQIRQMDSELTIENLGEPQVVVVFKAAAEKPRVALVVFIWLLLFTGSGLAIMNFHADVSMPDVHQKLYLYLTGKEESHPWVLQIPYSFGLGIGMVLFFNRIFKKRLNKEPDPLELEMYNYQENIHYYTVADHLKQQKEKEREQDE